MLLTILQEMYCLEGFCKKCIDLQESHKNCIILHDSCEKYVFGPTLQDSLDIYFSIYCRRLYIVTVYIVAVYIVKAKYGQMKPKIPNYDLI